ncbi:YcgL domain-containing protein [Rhodanobacter sp. 7MK24]|uniref:YcgL domain-containing protein n=1 Tax=Rhodanobacter sp. 7MK24 TaxID=2775922 RepID=UPI001784E947|nr:YcgL domain-containing protein [Rhodanobacter sp. 7MK24]MBD8879908.1 YcgL domain-containing protein [Rhodanobacter sp. 7MK24]
MQCYIYASRRKPDTYLWLAERDGFGVLPESLRSMLGELRFALELRLDAQRRLPREDTAQVLAHLHEQGWHLQLPPEGALTGASHPAYGATLVDAPPRD